MAKNNNKTQETNDSVTTFLDSVANEKKRQDSYAIMQLMQDVTGESPKLWGTSIIGFGKYHYRYASGREGESPLVGFSPRKQNFALYIMGGFEGREAVMERLGKFKTGKSCLYIKKIEDVDEDVLRELVKHSAEHAAANSVE